MPKGLQTTQLLQNTFGLTSFRPGQSEAIDKLLAGKSVLTVFPTGGGKSLCYQLPALLLEGLTLVVSPLIALMNDQVSTLQARGIAAERLDSSRTGDEVRAIYRQLHSGELKLLYIAPERLQNERFLSHLRGVSISLLAVDEAHCISGWGHNFRPDYLKLAGLARELNVERVLALTATATPSVAQDICRQFNIVANDHIQTGFYRPNLQLSIQPCRPQEKLPLLVQELNASPAAAAVVYVTLQKTAETVAEALRAEGIAAAAYHAGLPAPQREQIQGDFMAAQVRVVVATIAFGMGIDKSDIRTAYHYNLPKSLENYMQEIGRAGRDGIASHCHLLACRDDVRVLENFSYGDTPIPEHLAALIEYLLSQGESFDIAVHELSTRFDIRPLVISTALTYLELEGVIRGTGPFYSTYQVAFLQPEQSLYQRFDSARVDFLQRLFAQGKSGRKWLTIEIDSASQAIGESRLRLIKALDYLEQQGLIATQVKGVRQGYRRLQLMDLKVLSDKLQALFARREQQDILRLQQILDYAQSAHCLPAQLCAYFGESLAQPCGQCSVCRQSAARLPQADTLSLSPAQENRVAQLVDEAHPALAHPRQLSRFLCGLGSPATSRGPLRKQGGFGFLETLAFREVLTLAEKLLGGSDSP